jgi:hypothetical protein
MQESSNSDNRVLLELLETARDLTAYDLVTEADIAQIEALFEPQADPMKNAPCGAL